MYTPQSSTKFNIKVIQIQKCSLDRNVTSATYSWSSVTSCVHTKQQSYNEQQQQPKEQQLTTM